MKYLILLLIVVSCNKIDFDCSCEYVEYNLTNSEWVEVQNNSRTTKCEQPLFVIKNAPDYKTVIKCN